MQQAITIAIEKNNLFESQEQFSAWLAGVVKRCALNHRRKSIRQKTYTVNPLNIANVEIDEVKDHPVDVASGDLRPNQTTFDDQVIQGLQQLTPNARCCLLLRTVERLTYKEISNLMQIPQGTAMSLVHRSRKTLRDLLSSDDPSGSDLSSGGGSADG